MLSGAVGTVSVSMASPTYAGVYYGHDWIGELPELKGSISGCSGCNFTPPLTAYQQNSSSADFIVLVCMGSLRRLPMTVRSIRTTECRATIVVFTDLHIGHNPFAGCGVHIIEFGCNFGKSVNIMQAMRYPLIMDFIENYHFQMDRVLYADSFDTIFQCDPFSDHVNSSSLFLSSESHQLKSSAWSKFMLESGLYGFRQKEHLNDLVICSGLFMGGARPVYLLCKAVFNLFGPNFNVFKPDQIFFLLLMSTQFFAKIGVAVVLLGVGETLSTIGLRGIGFTNNKFPLAGKNGGVPCAIHQFFWMKEVGKVAESKCGYDANETLLIENSGRTKC
jgi:hypothetical protein